ncbi:MAG: homeobox protein 4 [Harvfovirus sp.]|uniref:Homeobox protein 4 n=1 Tax=Harvfovirus sp. TaxID=2487768 RepID=A0A3G5A0A1_9VIRU|nr:MAG: homeobox protein 4 [Harvfovirus sp.]
MAGTVVDPNENKILLQWLEANREHPYPSTRQKEELAIETGLELKQVNYWFTNVRRRLKIRKSVRRSSPVERSNTKSCVPVRHRSFTTKQVKILTNWARKNWNHPFPCPKEKEQMVAETKLTYDQVQLWFTNWRMRVWKKNREKGIAITEEKKSAGLTGVDSLRTRLSDFRQC